MSDKPPTVLLVVDENRRVAAVHRHAPTAAQDAVCLTKLGAGEKYSVEVWAICAAGQTCIAGEPDLQQKVAALSGWLGFCRRLKDWLTLGFIWRAIDRGIKRLAKI